MIRKLTDGDLMAEKLGIATFCLFCGHKIVCDKRQGIMTKVDVWVHEASWSVFCNQDHCRPPYARPR